MTTGAPGIWPDLAVCSVQAEEEEAAAAAEAAERAVGAAGLPAGPSYAARGYSDSEDEEEGDSASDASSQSRSDWAAESGAGASQMDARPGSIASTYWRPERSDRKNLLSTVDERCGPFPLCCSSSPLLRRFTFAAAPWSS